MAINWSKIQSDIDSFLRAGAADGNTSRTPEATADFVATAYFNEIMADAKEIYGNGVVTINKEPLKQSLLSAFQSDFQQQSGGASATNSSGTAGVVQVWAGGKMQTIVPPPPGMVPVSNDVTSPGSPFPMNVNNSTETSNVPLAVEIVKSLKQHAQTPSGINMWLFIPPTGPPVPIPGPWTGVS